MFDTVLSKTVFGPSQTLGPLVLQKLVLGVPLCTGGRGAGDNRSKYLLEGAMKSNASSGAEPSPKGVSLTHALIHVRNLVSSARAHTHTHTYTLASPKIAIAEKSLHFQIAKCKTTGFNAEIAKFQRESQRESQTNRSDFWGCVTDSQRFRVFKIIAFSGRRDTHTNARTHTHTKGEALCATACFLLLPFPAPSSFSQRYLRRRLSLLKTLAIAANLLHNSFEANSAMQKYII